MYEMDRRGFVEMGKLLVNGRPALIVERDWHGVPRVAIGDAMMRREIERLLCDTYYGRPHLRHGSDGRGGIMFELEISSRYGQVVIYGGDRDDFMSELKNFIRNFVVSAKRYGEETGRYLGVGTLAMEYDNHK